MPIIKQQQGFTLTEMIIVMVITSLIVMGSSVLLSSSFRNYFINVAISGLNTRAALTMTKFAKELQQARSISVLTATSVTFTTTDGSVITYSYANPVLTRTELATAQTVNNEVTAFALTYYQANYSTTTTGSAVRAVTVSATFRNANGALSLINSVFLHNM